MHPLEARTTRLQIGDADRVFIRHPQGEVTGCIAQQLEIAVVYIADRLELIEVEGGVALVLIVGEALDTGQQDIARFLRKFVLDTGRERLEARAGDGPRAYAWGYTLRCLGCFESCRKRGETRFDADAALSNRFLELRAIERQRAGRGERAKQGGADDAARLFSDLGEVGLHEILGSAGARVNELRRLH